jgi:beta-lactamase class A
MREQTRPTPPLPAPLAQALAAHQSRFSGTLALWVHDLRRRETYGLRAEEPFRPASTIKLFVLRELFRQAEAGALSLQEHVEVRQGDLVAGSGVLRDLTPGLRLSLLDVATLMITVSDNVAANVLVKRLGVAAINRAARAAGFADTHLAGLFMRRRAGRSSSTARDLGTLVSGMARRTAVSPAASRAMLGILLREQYDNVVGRRLPHLDHDGRPLRPWRVASKSGSLNGIRNDVALVRGNGLAYVVALLSRDCQDPRYTPDNEATVCLAGVAMAVHDYVGGRWS